MVCRLRWIQKGFADWQSEPGLPHFALYFIYLFFFAVRQASGDLKETAKETCKSTERDVQEYRERENPLSFDL